MHLILLLIVIVGLPEIWRTHRESLPTAISVEVLPISELTNIRRQEAQKKEQKKPVEKAVSKKATSASASNQPTEKVEKKVIAEQKVEEKTLPTKEKVKEKPKDEPKAKEKTEEKVSDLDAILKSVADAAKKDEGEKPTKANEETKKAVAEDYNPSLPMSMSEIDAIRSQFIKCWNIPSGARNAHELKVVLDVRLQEDGRVTSAELAEEKGRYYQDPFFKAAADSAIRAVYRCSPIQNLPTKKYDTWKYLQMTFDPRDMLY